MRDITSAVAKKAQELASHEGGFPPQEQDLPGHTGKMEPTPDHGEYTYTGCGKLQDLRALITGGDSGIGRAVAIAYAREGADVAISYLPAEQADAEETAQWSREAGRKAVLIPGDLKDEATCSEVIDRAVSELGGLDILVNNAGYQLARDDSLAEFSSERMDHTFKTNLYAMFWLTQRALEHLPRGGSIINTSSIQAFMPSPDLRASAWITRATPVAPPGLCSRSARWNTSPAVAASPTRRQLWRSCPRRSCWTMRPRGRRSTTSR